MEHVLILASQSPQRSSLLSGIGVRFEVVPSSVDEDGHPERSPKDRALTLAELKALTIAKMHPGRFVLGADTLVVSASGKLLEKPVDVSEAKMMLTEHSGNTSIVHSALCLITPDGSVFKDVDSSSVTFKKLTQ